MSSTKEKNPKGKETVEALSGQAADTEPQDHPYSSIFDPWLKQSEAQWTGARNANAMTQASSAAIHGSIQLWQEAGRFLSDRVKKDMTTLSSFAECRNSEDYFRAQSDFFDEAVRDYGEEIAKMAHMAADVNQSTCKPLEDRTKEALHSIVSIPKHNGQFV
ncbi:MAG: phasin family protein [Pseudomonadota bacterium]